MRNQQWADERGNRFNREQKMEWLRIMNNDELSDLAAITYSPHNDYCELWYTKLSPFRQNGLWVVIPGIRQRILQIEREERSRNN